MEIIYPELENPYVEGEVGKVEQALLIIKPDAFAQKDITDEILRLLEEQCLRVEKAVVTTMNEEIVNLLYAGRISPDWSNKLLEYLTQGSSAIFMISGIKSNEKANYVKTLIRKKYGVDFIHTMVHASDSEDEALEEGRLFF